MPYASKCYSKQFSNRSVVVEGVLGIVQGRGHTHTLRREPAVERGWDTRVA